jgi:cytochrome c oxidase assembly protein subunit 15
LGCPDWPGCYGRLLGVPEQVHELAQAARAFPDRPVHAGKAWKEMIHRYAASTLGLLVLALAISAWRRTRRVATLESALLGLVIAQAALGMWTVTLLLKPAIVTLHLLGGMATWAILFLLMRREVYPGAVLLPLGRLAVAVVFVQIGLGGWMSSNYASLACPDFPTCRNGNWWPGVGFADFGQAFALLRDLGAAAGGAALTAIHLTHRLGALVVLLVVGAFGRRLLKGGRRSGAVVLGALALQLGLGIANVVFALPLPIAVLHNLGAAALLGVLLATARGTVIRPPSP